jgi:hypothetical protein
MSSDDQVRPFLSRERHDVLRELATQRGDVIHYRVAELVARAIDPETVKIDGKGGSLDGTPGVILGGGLSSYVPICGAYPGPKIEHPKGKDTKEGKEAKDSKEGKEGKEAKDSKEGKDSSDGFKAGGDEVQDPFHRLGDSERLPWEAFNAIARAHPEAVQNAIARGGAVF